MRKEEEGGAVESGKESTTIHKQNARKSYVRPYSVSGGLEKIRRGGKG